MTGLYVVYVRVSTTRQGERGLGLEAQRAAIASYLKGATPIAEYVEVESGKSAVNRPQLHAALAACKRHGAVLLIAKLDRLSRNVAFTATF